MILLPTLSIFHPTADCVKERLNILLIHLKKKMEMGESWRNGPGKELVSAMMDLVFFDNAEMEW